MCVSQKNCFNTCNLSSHLIGDIINVHSIHKVQKKQKYDKVRANFSFSFLLEFSQNFPVISELCAEKSAKFQMKHNLCFRLILFLRRLFYLKFSYPARKNRDISGTPRAQSSKALSKEKKNIVM